MEFQTVVEFQKRRRRTWHAIRLWVLLAIVSFVGFSIPFWTNSAIRCSHTGFASSKCILSPDDTSLWQFNLLLVSFIGMGVSIVAITLAVRRYYRCPKCEAVPTGSWTSLGPTNIGMQRGIPLNPSVCGRCGARLR